VIDGSDWITSTAASKPAQPLTLQAGQEFGPFTIVRPLGSGGMGQVYEAEERDTGRRVALKVLTGSIGVEQDRARFNREGRLAASISHPHTIYVYGTDEIQGVPVIAMELAPGGTLRDLVSAQGPLPPRQAVDIVLQVVAGLEAAADAGVLHRDIKPSNCFIDSDGTIKVGDFGLSISTLATDERTLTMRGTVLGTPAFASPEQLRGDDLDVRSDIYSVGGTLYYLLTGKAPFDQSNLLRLVSQVAQETPVPPRAIRADLPRELDVLVLRCLAKRPSERFADYDELRAALEPFSSASPAPANPGVRFMAGIVDSLVLWAFAIPLAAWFGDPLIAGRRDGMVQTSLATWAVSILYYGLPEGAWGRSLGKQFFGLRVIDDSRQRPGAPRALARASIWTIGPGFVLLAYSYAMAPLMAASQNTPAGGLLGLTFPLLGLALVGLMFVTARHANSYAGLHDLLTGMRVVTTKPREDRARTPPTLIDRPGAGDTPRIGPYVVLEAEPLRGDDVVVGYDDRLQRPVWLRRVGAGDPQVPAERRALSRSTRPRWLAGRRTGREAWDAFEAFDGAALVNMPGQPHAWCAVRQWLLDLSLEIRAGLADGSLPPLTLNRVWITAAGRARLIDWPADGARSVDAAPDFAAAQKLLRDVAGSVQGPLPLAARSFLDRLGRSEFASPDALVETAEALVTDAAVLGRRRRIGHLAFCALLPILVALFIVTIMWIFIHPLVADPELGDLATSLQRLEHLTARPEAARETGEIRALEIYVAGTHRSRIEDPATWSQGTSFLRVSPRLKELAQRAIAAHPDPTAADVRAAAAAFQPAFTEGKRELEQIHSPFGLLAMFLLYATGVFVIVAALGLLSAFVFRGGLQLWFFGAAVVSDRGENVSRPHALWRALLAWSPVGLGIVGLALAPEFALSGRAWMIACASSLALLLVGAIYAARHPERGLQDRIAGTWLVPR
jgi:uncharacterized RDD family membrane protein YckC